MQRLTKPARVDEKELLKILNQSDVLLFISFKEDQAKTGFDIGPLGLVISKKVANIKSMAVFDELCENLTRYLEFYTERRKKEVKQDGKSPSSRG